MIMDYCSRNADVHAPIASVFVVLLLATLAHCAGAQNSNVAVSFQQNYLATTDANHTRVLNGGLVELVLDQYSGMISSFEKLEKMLASLY